MSDALNQFLRDSIARARRELPYDEALQFLHGLAITCGTDSEVLRSALFSIGEGDRQLELIATGQITLDFKQH